MARSRFIYTLKQVAVMIGENLELIEEVTATRTTSPRANWFTSAMAVKMARRV